MDTFHFYSRKGGVRVAHKIDVNFEKNKTWEERAQLMANAIDEFLTKEPSVTLRLDLSLTFNEEGYKILLRLLRAKWYSAFLDTNGGFSEPMFVCEKRKLIPYSIRQLIDIVRYEL